MVRHGVEAEHHAVAVADVLVEFVHHGVIDHAAGPVGAVQVVGAVGGPGLLWKRVVADDVLGY